MNRRLAILILGFGTLIMVAHAAIPHHHHEGVVCYHHDIAQGYAQGSSHQHGPISPLDYNCILKQLYLAPSVSKELITNAIQMTRCSPVTPGLPGSGNLILPPESIPLKLPSDPPIQYQPGPVILLSGPRAPPLCF